MRVDGRCLCGQITYRAEVDPERCAVCHCTDCQANSGTAFGWVVHIPGDFELLSGTLRTYVKTADSGNRRELAFCPDCGTRIYARNADGSPGMWGLRVGSVTQRAELPPKVQVFCDSAHDWLRELGALPALPRGPARG